MAVTYRVGVDIGGTFTDIVLLGSDGTIHTKKISSSVGNYAQAIVDGLSEVFSETGLGGARHRGDPPRHHRRLQRHPRAQGRARRADHHQGLPRRAGDPHAAHAQALRPRLDQAARRWSSATCARWSTSASTMRGQVERALDPADAERAVDALLAEKVEAIAVCLLNSFANPGARGDAAATSSPRKAPHLPLQRLVRGAARDQGIRAHLDHGHQRLRDADRRDLPAGAAPGARRRRHPGPPAADAVERRPHDRCAPPPSGR